MDAWMEDDLVSMIPKEKLEFLSELFSRGKGRTPKQLMREVLPLIKKGKEQGLSLSSQEMAAAISAIKKHSSKEENEKIDELLKKAGRA